MTEVSMAPPSGPAQMHVSIRDAMLHEALDPHGPSSTWDALATLGVNAIELEYSRDRSLPKVVNGRRTATSIATDTEAAAFAEPLILKNVKVSALLLGTDFAGPNPEAEIDWALAAIAAAESLGAPAIRIDATHWGGMPIQKIRERCVHCISRILDQSSGSSVDLGIENHGKVSNNPAYLAAIFADVPNPRLGLTLDTGNFYWYGYPLGGVYSAIERFAPRARHTHIKTINYPPELASQQREVGFEYGKYCSPLYEGNLDLLRIIRLLHAGGYRRGLCIENEALSKYPVGERLQVLQREVITLNEAIEKIAPP